MSNLISSSGAAAGCLGSVAAVLCAGTFPAGYVLYCVLRGALVKGVKQELREEAKAMKVAEEAAKAQKVSPPAPPGAGATMDQVA